MRKTTAPDLVLRFSPLLIPILALLLYLPYIDNPLVFDDLYFFVPGNPETYVQKGIQLRPRWLSYYSHGLTFLWLGPEVRWQRIGNIGILITCTLTLYLFILSVLRVITGTLTPRRLETAAVGASLLFIAHPATAFGAAYLIQRTTLLATLFSLLTWLTLWCGLRNRNGLIWLSVPFFALAALSKEHCVMAPAVSMLLIILHWRTNPDDRPWRDKATISVLLLQFTISVLLVLHSLRWIGTPYEPEAARLLQEAASRGEYPGGFSAYILSAINQTGLFFKYIGIWLAPTASGISIDMREPFITDTSAAASWYKVAAFFSYGVASAWLLLKGRTLGALGFSLLAPLLLFLTELSTIRIQEIFVVYRSVLWAPPFFIAVALGLSRLEGWKCLSLAVIVAGTLSTVTLNRLTTFSQPLFLWDEAISLVEEQVLAGVIVTGTERMYHNRGLALHAINMRENAINDYTKALDIKPDYAQAYSDRGAALLELQKYEEALQDFRRATAIDPILVRAHAGKMLSLRALQRPDDARNAARVACSLGWSSACEE